MAPISSTDRFQALLIRHEGIRLKLYLDCCGRYWRECTCAKKGRLTGGCGRNFDDVGLSTAETMVLLANDIERAENRAASFSWFKSLSVVRQDVVLDMLINLADRFDEFKEMIEAIRNGNFERAAAEMLNSAWAGQVGARARELAQMMRLDRYLSQGEIAQL